MNVLTGYAVSGAAQLYYEEMGAGFPVVFVHAAIANLHMWDDQFPAFANKFRAIRYDMRGYGRSKSAPGPFSMHEDLHAVLNQLGVQRAALVGCSMGGIAVVDFTLENPGMVAALVAVGAGLSGVDDVAEKTPLMQAYEDAEKARDYDLATDYALRVWVDGKGRKPEDVPAALREKVRAWTRASYDDPPDWGKYRDIDPPAAARLDQIRVPLLAIAGDRDVPEILTNTDMLAAAPQGRKVILRGTAHLPNMERPDDFNAVVMGFLDGVLE